MPIETSLTNDPDTTTTLDVPIRIEQPDPGPTLVVQDPTSETTAPSSQVDRNQESHESIKDYPTEQTEHPSELTGVQEDPPEVEEEAQAVEIKPEPDPEPVMILRQSMRDQN